MESYDIKKELARTQSEIRVLAVNKATGKECVMTKVHFDKTNSQDCEIKVLFTIFTIRVKSLKP